MTKTLLRMVSGLFVVLVMVACNPASEPILPTPVPSAIPQPTVEKVLPTPFAPGRMITYDSLQVVMSQAEITAGYLTEYGSTRQPPAGEEFLWIHINLKNTGQDIRDLPAPEHFSVLNETAEFKPAYGHRMDHPDYMSLTTALVEGQAVDAWLRFDIPAALELKELVFVFLPESSVVSVGFSSTDYPVGDHPIFLWNCAP
jgi:hypothetical protein